jgi:hypothetical protein
MVWSYCNRAPPFVPSGEDAGVERTQHGNLTNQGHDGKAWLRQQGANAFAARNLPVSTGRVTGSRWMISGAGRSAGR